MTILASWDEGIAGGVRRAIRGAVVVVEHLDELRALLRRRPGAAVLLDARVGGSGCRAVETVPELRALDPAGLMVLCAPSPRAALAEEARAYGCAGVLDLASQDDVARLGVALVALRAMVQVRARRARAA